MVRTSFIDALYTEICNMKLPRVSKANSLTDDFLKSVVPI